LKAIPYVSSRKEIKAAIYKHYFRADTIEPVRKTILIVDDDHMVLERLHKILARYYKVFSANNGMEAYKEAVTKKPHVILTDKEMPKLDGFGLLNAVQSMPETKRIPVILLSGSTNAELESKAFQNGFFDFIQKPIKETTVLTRVKRAFDFYEQQSYATKSAG
jgi:PleD family two-component response regulator